MKTSSIISLFAVIIIGAITLILVQTFKVDRNLQLVKLVGTELCFLVNGDQFAWSDSKDAKVHAYRRGANSGKLRLVQQKDFSKDMTHGNLNGLEYAYKKIKNYRFFEYAVKDHSWILRDEYLYKKRSPGHIVFFKQQCQEMSESYKVVEYKLEFFDEDRI